MNNLPKTTTTIEFGSFIYIKETRHYQACPVIGPITTTRSRELILDGKSLFCVFSGKADGQAICTGWTGYVDHDATDEDECFDPSSDGVKQLDKIIQQAIWDPSGLHVTEKRYSSPNGLKKLC